MTGKTINNYTIERSLGEGGMGNVYLARHNRVDRLVAIKVLHQNLFTNESIRNRFKNEANALIKLEHPNIVRIYDYVEQDDFAGLIMEYIDGYTLDEYILKVSGPLVTSKATHIICRVLDAVQYAHDNNIYHRDIKPGNIMVSKDGMTVRIMDFGIAKFMDTENFKNTHAHTQLGTPFYMSPEQVKGLPYTGLSDIYSLGVTLFEMVTGKCPYQFITNLFELHNKIVNEPLPPTNTYYPDVSPRLQAAIIKATEKKPGLRFLSCKEFTAFLLADAEQNPMSSALHTGTLKRPGEKTKDQSPKPFHQQPAGNIPVAKNITPPNLLETYPAKKKKMAGWVIPVSISIVILGSALYYFKNGKKDPAMNNPVSVAEQGGIDSSRSNNSLTPDSKQTDSTGIGVPVIPGTDSPGTGITSNAIKDSFIKEESKNTVSENTQKYKEKNTSFTYFDKPQVFSFLAGKLICNGEVYDGQNQVIKFDDFPRLKELKEMKISEVRILYFQFIGKTPGNSCNYQIICTKREKDFEFSKPIKN